MEDFQNQLFRQKRNIETDQIRNEQILSAINMKMKTKMNRHTEISRRAFIGDLTSAAILPFFKVNTENSQDLWGRAEIRDYSVCLNSDLILADPEMLQILADAGVKGIWIATYFYGYWPYQKSKIIRAKELVQQKEMDAFAITIPFGHPGDSLQAGDDAFPLISPAHWPRTLDMDGNLYAGTTVNDLVNIENARALQEVSQMGFRQCMADDDFRIARLPGVIGGSFDDKTRSLFLERGGYSAAQWSELLDDIRSRRFTPVVKDWVDWYCDRMTESFRIQQKAFAGDFGIMVMYLGAEKAGIRLSDYRGVQVRVGEAHFNDRDLKSPKGWTDELFSVLFHRRYVKPEDAWSETTAFPADALSVENMIAKLTISTIADVRHTTFMSGLTPLPKSYWKDLPSAMRLQKKHHEMIAGYALKGPFKHFWGEASRYVGKDRPFSLWLAMGVPFEVIDEPEKGEDGWVFMSDEDYTYLGKRAQKANVVVREGLKKEDSPVQALKEEPDDLWRWKKQMTPLLKNSNIPYVIENEPAVCAWYPQAKRVLIWSLSTVPVHLTLQYGSRQIARAFKPLESSVVKL